MAVRLEWTSHYALCKAHSCVGGRGRLSSRILPVLGFLAAWLAIQRGPGGLRVEEGPHGAVGTKLESSSDAVGAPTGRGVREVDTWAGAIHAAVDLGRVRPAAHRGGAVRMQFDIVAQHEFDGGVDAPGTLGQGRFGFGGEVTKVVRKRSLVLIAALPG